MVCTSSIAESRVGLCVILVGARIDMRGAQCWSCVVRCDACPFEVVIPRGASPRHHTDSRGCTGAAFGGSPVTHVVIDEQQVAMVMVMASPLFCALRAAKVAFINCAPTSKRAVSPSLLMIDLLDTLPVRMRR